jgi:hypothetical protein
MVILVLAWGAKVSLRKEWRIHIDVVQAVEPRRMAVACIGWKHK